MNIFQFSKPYPSILMTDEAYAGSDRSLGVHSLGEETSLGRHSLAPDGGAGSDRSPGSHRLRVERARGPTALLVRVPLLRKPQKGRTASDFRVAVLSILVFRFPIMKTLPLSHKKIISYALSLGLGCYYSLSSSVVLAEFAKKPITTETWLQHLEKDLNPFWLIDIAQGKPQGNFPSFRCNDGSLVNIAKPCDEFSQLDSEYGYIKNQINNHFMVAQSSQVVAYSLAYNLTGDIKFLELAKSGVDWLVANGLDRENGGAFTYLEGNKQTPGRAFELRTSQEQAFVLSGLATYYYITHDPEILEEIIKFKSFIFTNYYDKKEQAMMWVPINNSPREDWFKQRKSLVSHLNQLSSYLLLLTPILPKVYQNEWQNDIVNLTNIILNNFYSSEYNTFVKDLDKEGNIKPDNTNYGYSIKSLWAVYQAGKLTNNSNWLNFAQIQGEKLLKQAYDEKSGAWAHSFRIKDSGEIEQNLDKEWWVYIALNNMAATLSLNNQEIADKYLNSTVSWWLNRMVDHQNHEVWTIVTADSWEPQLPKQYQWKNGGLNYSHVLTGYLTSQARNKQPATLYFARPIGQENEGIIPYYYQGELVNITTEKIKSMDNMLKVKAVFHQIR